MLHQRLPVYFLLTNRTLLLHRSSVLINVLLYVSKLIECLIAAKDWADEGLLARVYSQVIENILNFLEELSAVWVVA